MLTTTESFHEIPKDLADCMESVIGAVYLDSGGDLVKTWSVFRPLFIDLIGMVIKNNLLVANIKTFPRNTVN